MTTILLDTVRRYAEAHLDSTSVTPTPIPGLTIIRQTMPTALHYNINKPLVAIVLQGSKRVIMGKRVFDFGAGESLLITADVPTVSQITSASIGAPYFSLVLDLNPSVIEGLVVEIDANQPPTNTPVRVHPTETEVLDAALRLIQLLERPGALAILQNQLIRELHFWLMMGRHGGAIRTLGTVDSHAQRIARAVALIRTNFAEPLRVEQLAVTAGMSLSSFYEHFRAITSLTPLQFQKQLRLIEARRMMLANGEMISNAAYAVGYESVSQFTREYGRLFGLPPRRDIKTINARTQSAA